MEVKAMKRLTLEQIESMPTLHQGHTDNLIYETDKIRIWRSRLTKSDGAPYNNQITVEKFLRGKWVIVAQYQPR